MKRFYLSPVVETDVTRSVMHCVIRKSKKMLRNLTIEHE